MKKLSIILIVLLLVSFVGTSMVFATPDASSSEEPISVEVEIGGGESGGTSNMLLYMGIGIVVLIAIVAIVSMTNSGKKA